MIEAEGLVKRYGTTVALAGVDLSVPPGAILGVLGPNGAGKTTAIRILTTLSHADEGRAWVAGFDVAAHPPRCARRIGVAAQATTLDELLTGRQNLVMIGQLSGLRRSEARRRAADLLERLELSDAADRLSHGLLRRHAPSARPRRQHDHGAARPLPRRAHHRARPGQPARGVGGDPRDGRATAARSCSPPSTSTRPTISPTPSPSSTTAG